jgi:hypothetical protein
MSGPEDRTAVPWRPLVPSALGRLGAMFKEPVEEPMRLVFRGASFVLAVSMAALGLGCSSEPPAPNSFTEVYAKVIRPSCTSDFCHYNGVGIRYSALDLSSQVVAYWSLVDQPCAGPSCSEMGTRVLPGQPNDSILYLKVSQTMPPCGTRMPADTATLVNTQTTVFSGTPLTDDLQTLIYNWIQDGALDN